MKLYTVTIEEDNCLSPACLFSTSLIDVVTVKKLRFGQKVVEAQWLSVHNPTPCLVVLLPSDAAKFGTILFDNVSLINPDDWAEVVNQSDVLLLNASMFELCKEDGTLFLKLKYFDSEHLKTLFEEHMFVVAGVY